MTEEIYIQFRSSLLSFIQTKIKNKADAEDVLHDVFIKIHRNIKTLKEDKKLIPWIYQITRNQIIDFYRKSKHTNEVVDIAEQVEENETILPEDFSECIDQLTIELSDNSRDLLYKTAFLGVSQKEYAAELGIPYSTLKSRVQRARKELKGLIEDCCMLETDKYGNILSVQEKDCSC